MRQVSSVTSEWVPSLVGTLGPPGGWLGGVMHFRSSVTPKSYSSIFFGGGLKSGRPTTSLSTCTPEKDSNLGLQGTKWTIGMSLMMSTQLHPVGVSSREVGNRVVFHVPFSVRCGPSTANLYSGLSHKMVGAQCRQGVRGQNSGHGWAYVTGPTKRFLFVGRAVPCAR